jgi:hypothetical protein
MGNYVAQLFLWVCNFTPFLFLCFDSWLGELIERVKEWRVAWVGGGSTISEKWGTHLSCQSTIAAQLLENGGKIEPYTIIIMFGGTKNDHFF